MHCFMGNHFMKSLQTCIYKNDMSAILKKILKRTVDAMNTIASLALFTKLTTSIFFQLLVGPNSPIP